MDQIDLFDNNSYLIEPCAKGEKEKKIAQSAGAIECIDRFSVEGNPPPNECLAYNTKQSDCELPVMLELWGNVENPFIAITPRSTLVWSGST